MEPKSRPTPAGVYEDFEPRYQWVSSKDVDTVVVDLTGEAEFKKEHLKVKIDNHGNLKVSGERPLGGGGDRWRRFQKLFRMADDCITTDIKAKFDNGILSVAMPKLIRDQPSATPPPPPPPPAAAPQTPSAAPAAPPAKPDPRMEAASRKAPEEGQAQAAATAEGGRSDSPRDKRAGEPAPEPAPPQAPKYGTGTRRRWRQVVVVVMVAAAVGLGIYYWSHWKGFTPDEQQQQQMDICLSEF